MDALIKGVNRYKTNREFLASFSSGARRPVALTD
jgi:hypothetical protein